MTKTEAPDQSPQAPSATEQRAPKPPERAASSAAKSLARAALPSADGQPQGAIGRARMSIVMQRSLGNGRIARIHDGATDRADADRLNAKAITNGSNIWIGSPGSPDERKRMAHELTPVVQQTGTVQQPPADTTGAAGTPKPGRAAAATTAAHRSTGKQHAARASRAATTALRRRAGPKTAASGGGWPAAEPPMPELMAASPDWSRSEVIVPSLRSEGARAVGDAIAQSAQEGRRGLVESVQRGTHLVRGEVAQQRGVVYAAGARQARRIQGEFAAAHAQLGRTISSAQAELEAEAQAQQAALGEWHGAAVSQAGDIFNAGAQRAMAMGDTYGERALQAADDSANQAAGQLEAQIAEARRIGEQRAAAGSSKPEVAEAKAKAARDLAADTEGKVRDAVDDFLPKLRANGSDVAQSYRGEGANASVQVELALAPVLVQIGAVHEETAGALGRGVNQAAHALSNAEAQIGASLASSEHKAVTQLHAQVSRHARELNQVGQHAAASLDAAGRKAAKAGDGQLSSLTEKLADNELDEKATGSVTGTVANSIVSAYRPVYNQVDQASLGIRNQISGTGANTVAAIDTTGPTVGTRLGGMVNRTQETIGTQTTSVTTQLEDMVVQTKTGADGMFKDIGTGIDTQLGTMDEAFGKGLTDYRQGLDKKSTEALDDVRDPVKTLPDRIATAQARVEAEADKSWLRRQWDNFVDMISDPGFWVTIFVGIALVALAIFLLPEELGLLAIAGIGAAIGAISVGLGTIVSNLYHGRPWHENLLRNTLIGAGAGAIFALASVALVGLGFGVGSLGFVAGMSLTAGAVTIVTNLINGRPWDEGLLANMALAGLFAWAAKFFPRIGPKQEEPPEPGLGETGQVKTIPQRLAEFYQRLRSLPNARTPEEALRQIRETLNEVEDEFSGVPRKDPPPPPNMPDGRMYPPLDDFTTRNPDGSLSARTRGHNIEMGKDGSIRITNRKTGGVDFEKPGGGQE